MGPKYPGKKYLYIHDVNIGVISILVSFGLGVQNATVGIAVHLLL